VGTIIGIAISFLALEPPFLVPDFFDLPGETLSLCLDFGEVLHAFFELGLDLSDFFNVGFFVPPDLDFLPDPADFFPLLKLFSSSLDERGFRHSFESSELNESCRFDVFPPPFGLGLFGSDFVFFFCFLSFLPSADFLLLTWAFTLLEEADFGLSPLDFFLQGDDGIFGADLSLAGLLLLSADPCCSDPFLHESFADFVS